MRTAMRRDDVAQGSAPALERGFYSGTAWLLVQQVLTRTINFFSGIVIARLLTPLDFGLMNLATTFSNLVMAVGNIGVGHFLVYQREEKQEYLTAGFWLGMTASLGLFLIQVIVAPLVAAFYGTPIVAPVMIVLGITFFLIAPLGGIHQAVLQKRMEYRRLIIPQIVMTLVGTGLTIFLAALGWGVWSLALPGLVAFPLGVAVTWMMCDFRPSFQLHRQYWGEIFRYGRNVLGSELVTFVNNNADYILIGKLLGATRLGFYSFAYAQSMMIVALMMGVFSQVVFPIFARLQNHQEELRAAYFRFLRRAAAVMIPLALLQMIVAEEFIGFLYSEKWTDAITPFRFLLLYAVGRSLALGAMELLNAVGRPDLGFKYSLAMAPVFTTAVILGTRWGIVGVAAATGIVFGGSQLILVGLVLGLFRWRWAAYAEAIRPALQTAAAVALASAAVRLLAKQQGAAEAMTLLLTLGAGGVTHLVMLRLYFSEEAKALRQLLVGRSTH